jgi:hypothetical protein
MIREFGLLVASRGGDYHPLEVLAERVCALRLEE